MSDPLPSDLQQLVREILQFRDARDWQQFHTPRNLAAALSIEAAELQELMLWKSDVEVEQLQRDPAKRDALRHELADVLIYALLLAHTLGEEPARVIREKLAHNTAKYPVEKSRGNASKYTEL